jgi:hypothetical protein
MVALTAHNWSRMVAAHTPAANRFSRIGDSTNRSGSPHYRAIEQI